ncbi:MAG: hypothetical protein IT368_06305 [Candidatus Hydrogenedentes bacterium]|nr:hypothetical protein [Candidatus Hydrogenedentota bacterium]
MDAVLPPDMLTGPKVEAAIAADPDYTQVEEIDLGSFDPGPDPVASGTCPLPLTLDVLDQMVEIGDADLCSFLAYISWFVRISASLLAVGIVTGVHVTRVGGA